jgi:hypothetical protein
MPWVSTPYVLKETVATGQGLSDQSAPVVQQLQHRVKQEGQQIQRQQRMGQIQLAVTKVLMSSFSIFQRVRPNHLFDIGLGDEVTAYEGSAE